MNLLAICIIVAFVAGYLCIALESVIRVNKAAIALLMFVVCRTLFMIAPGTLMPIDASQGDAATAIGHLIERHLGETSTTLFFLMGAMTIVEIVDQNGGFDFVRDALSTRRPRVLLWRIAFITFFLSAILDNLTTSIVMIMVLRKLVSSRNARLIYGSLVVIAANSGGAFSPIGDVTTIMLWNKSLITASGAMTRLFLPSLASMIIPAFLLQFLLDDNVALSPRSIDDDDEQGQELTLSQRRAVLLLGVGGLIFVPVFRYLTGLPPFVGILLVLSLLWIVTELFYSRLHSHESEKTLKRVTHLLSRIDMATILFFLGILMAVTCLEDIGALKSLGETLNRVAGGNHYLVTGAIGVISSIVDNVPLVAGCMGMYPQAAVGDLATDGTFWLLLAYCAGVGGSMLIIGSAAGVVVMGLEKINFGWYLRRIAPIAFAGYVSGMLLYRLQDLLF